MRVFLNGFWEGFVERTDGVHFGVFESILSRVFEQPIQLTSSMTDADILLESHCAPSVFSAKSWKYSIFFSGEGSMSVPDHAERYSAVLGALKTRRNHVKCPLFALYDACTPSVYPSQITQVPPKGVCAIVSSDLNPSHAQRFRVKLVDELMSRGVQVDMGGAYKNNIGYKISGQYYEQPIIDFQSQYRVVLALENTKLDEYITEKLVNPLRAGVVPVYYGSDKSVDYVCSDRFVQVTNDIQKTVDDIQRLCSDDTYWLHTVNQPPFVRPIGELLDRIVDDLRTCIFSYAVEVIGNVEKEAPRLKTLQPILDYFQVVPSTACYGDTARTHPYFGKFKKSLTINEISLAINHIALLEKYANSGRFLLIFESDAIPTVSMPDADAGIRMDIRAMREHGVQFAFICHGCINVGEDVYTNPDNRLGETLYVPRFRGANGASRCDEAYIISPEGMRSFLAWFRPRVNHDAIDWAFNHYFIQTPTALGCWRHPVLFRQGSEDKLYPSLLNRV